MKLYGLAFAAPESKLIRDTFFTFWELAAVGIKTNSDILNREIVFVSHFNLY